MLNAPDIDDPIGLRDRAMFELMYACGLRVSELCNLPSTGLNLRQGVLRVMGKGSKERMVPLGEEAQHWLQRYLAESRPKIAGKRALAPLFLEHSGEAPRGSASGVGEAYAAARGDRPAPHQPAWAAPQFRHALLNRGADLRALQLLLGHSSLSTTQIYTLVAREHLQKLHAKHHPRG